MGQYRQWLHYREVDQHLQTQMAAFEKELVQLQEHVQRAENETSYADNDIIQALIRQRAEKLLAEVAEQFAQHQQMAQDNEEYPQPPLTTPDKEDSTTKSANRPHDFAPGTSTSDTASETPVMPPKRPVSPKEPKGSVSAALAAWGNLPNFSSQDIQEPGMPATAQPFIPTPSNAQETLLPQDVSALMDEYSLTDPQVKMPWWLRNSILAGYQPGQETSPVDQQSQRTNQLVQRWFERWRQTGQQNKTTRKAQER